MTLLFFVQRVLLSIALPPASLLLLVLVGAGLKYKSHPGAGKACMATGLVLLYLLSLTPVASSLIAPLEAQHPPLVEARAPVDAVVVLTGGTKQVGLFSIGAVPDDGAMVRLVEGVYQQQKYSGVPLVICGGKADPTQPRLSSGAAMANRAIRLGVDPAEVLVEDASFNTLEGAKELRKALTSQGVETPHIVLVTSAFHMGRAARFFEQVGFSVDAAPTGFAAQEKGFGFLELIPSAHALSTASTAIYEYCVRFWYLLVGT